MIILEMLYKCSICKYNTNKYFDFNKHLGTIKHLKHENENNYCCKCNKFFDSNVKYIRHHNYHIKNNDNNDNDNNDNDNNDNNDDYNNKYNNKLDQVKEEIIKSNDQVKDEVIKSNEEVKIVVNKAITKATSLIKYLMEHHQNVPPIKKITDKQSIKLLRIDYDCPTTKPNDFELESALVYDHSKGRFVKNISK